MVCQGRLRSSVTAQPYKINPYRLWRVIVVVMCFFPRPNNFFNSIAYQKGITEYDCGKCPECLSKRSNAWALRAVAHAKTVKKACMVTLTYDSFIYDEKGNIIGENLNLRKVDKRDCQLFIKRLREYFDRVKGVKDIKYILSAEYGKRTGRPHYHAILFNVDFGDLQYHKKSKRGNTIYRSPLLQKLWKHGICTVDSKRISPAVAKYCTKYCMKDFGADDTFMLVSNNLGIDQLLKEFNGRSYWIDGQEYPIPRAVWNKYIMEKYHFDRKKFSYVNRLTGEIIKSNPTYRYINKDKSVYNGIRYSFKKIVPLKGKVKKTTVLFGGKMRTFLYVRGIHFKTFDKYEILRENVRERLAFGKYKWYSLNVKAKMENPFKLLNAKKYEVLEMEDIPYVVNKKARRLFMKQRDLDPVYQGYLEYWKQKGAQRREQPIETRIALLQDRRYHGYKTQARKYLFRFRESGYTDFRSRPRFETTYQYPIRSATELYARRHLPETPCHIRANDRQGERKSPWIIFGYDEAVTKCIKNIPIIKKIYEQQNFFNKIP